MITRRSCLRTLSAAALGLGPSVRAAEPDWPQFRGPRRDGMSDETGLLGQWPEGGPKLLWTIGGLGVGYGSIAVAGDKIFVQGSRGNESYVNCLSRADGKQLWSATMGPMGDNDRGDGARGTPTVQGDVVYALSEQGLLACLKTSDGSPVWRKHILKDYGGENPHWLVSESPLVDGDKVLVTPGGSGAGIVAINKANGREIWRSRELSDRAHYSSLVTGAVGGVRFATTMTSSAGVGVRLDDGKLMWRYERACNRTANCAMPIVSGNHVFYSSAYGTGGGVVELSPTSGALQAEELWFNREMMNHHGGLVLVNGHLYGFSNSILTCMELATGNVKWKDRSVGKGSLTFAEGKLYLLGENGTAGLAEATPEGYKEHGRFPVGDEGKPVWAYPVVCGGKLYIRNQQKLSCYSIKA